MANKFMIFWAAAIVALAAGASAQTAVIQPKAASALQTIILTADTAANSPSLPAAGSAAQGGAPAARLSITTDPPEAAVKIDGKDYGLTPVEAADLDTGSHVVELSKSGYFRRKATIRLDTAAAELHFELSRPAALVVTSEPAGARITLDGQDAGTSPVQNDKLRPGEHQVSAELDGYKTFETTINIESGGVDTLHITLESDITPPQEPEQVKKADKTGKSQWQTGTILLAFFIFIAVMIGVEKSSY